MTMMPTTEIVSVRLDELVPYDHNPRTTRNPKFDAILESIEATGLEHPPNISRRSPDDPCYMIIDGGNTRLEILNLLYAKYTHLAQQAESEEERCAYSSKAESFFVIECTFKPWVSESRALTGHMSENENRGDMLFIEKAHAVEKLKQIYEMEDRNNAQSEGREYKPLSGRQLAERITSQGWSIDHSHISRYDYAVNTLMKAIPNIFWAGAGHSLVRSIRKYDVCYTRFWGSTEVGQVEPERIESLFFDTLCRYDGESLDLQMFLQDLNAQLGKHLNLNPSMVMVEIEAIMHGRSASSAPLVPPGLSPEALVKKYKDTAPPGVRGASDTHQAVSPTGSETQASDGSTQHKASTKVTKAQSCQGRHGDHISSVTGSSVHGSDESTEAKLLGMVSALAEEYGIGIVQLTPEEGGGSAILFGVEPIDRVLIPGEDEELATVWWALTKYSLSFIGDKPNRYARFITVLKEQFSQYFERLEGPVGTLLFFEEAILSISVEIRDQLHEIQHLCGLMLQEIAPSKQ